MLDTIKNDVTM